MLRDIYKKFFIKIEYIYFSDVFVQSKADIVKYYQSSINNKKGSKNFFSNIIDLKNSKEFIKSNFRKSLINEINQAEKKFNFDIIYDYSPDEHSINSFINFFNNFAKNKNINFADKSKLQRLKGNIVFSKALMRNNILVWHVYIFDDFKFRLLYSSNNVSCDNEFRKIIVRANKLLHFKDIIYAKEKKFKVYDFGGISNNEGKLNGVDEFKLGFSKQLECTYNFTFANSFKGNILLFIIRFFSKIFNI